jgi:hypothetical protein
MKFAQWFNENELTGQTPQTHPETLPDPRQFSYIACVLDLPEQGKLERDVMEWIKLTPQGSIPPNWTWRAHHMTVKPPGVSSADLERYRQFFGQIVHLTVYEIAANDKCVAVKVKPDKAFPIVAQVPHITVAHSNEVKPQYSNDLFGLVKSFPVPPRAYQSSFVAVMRDQRNVWPDKIGVDGMAVPQKVR